MFEAVNHLIFEKANQELDNNIMSQFSPYMVTRYLSFCSKEHATYANDTLNVYGNVLKSPDDQFRFYDNVIPKLRRMKIPYVKRPKETEKVKDDVPIPEFYSKREIELLTNALK